MKIRKATKKDLKKIAEIWTEGFRQRPYNQKWTEKRALEVIKNSFNQKNIFLVSEEDKEVVGFLIGYFFPYLRGLHGMIDDLIISKKYRGKGHGIALMNEFEKMVEKKKGVEINLLAHKKARAHGMYKRKGFKETGFVLMEKKKK